MKPVGYRIALVTIFFSGLSTTDSRNFHIFFIGTSGLFGRGSTPSDSEFESPSER